MERQPLLTALEATLLVVVALVLAAAALTGSGSDDDESAPRGREDRPAEEAVGRIRVAPIVRRVERLRGLEFRRPLKVRFLTPAEARTVYRSRAVSEYSLEQQRIDEETLKLVGLIPKSTDLRRVLRTVGDEQILGFYDDRSKRLAVIREPGANRALLEIVLAHELVHALEDQHFGLEDVPGFTNDEAAAESALVEGTATALMTDYAGRYLKLEDLLDVVENVSGTETKLPRFIEQSLLFPYLEGEKFVTTFRGGGSWRAIDKVYELRRPRSTEQVLHPEKYAVDERPARVQAPNVARRLGEGWVRLDSSSVGEFDLRMLFRQVGRVKGSGAAAGWGGGRFDLWRRRTSGADPCAAPCVERDVGVLSLVWDTTADRTEAESALRRVFERGLDGERIASSAGVGLWSSRGGAIALLGRGRRSTIVFAPTAQLAARLLQR